VDGIVRDLPFREGDEIARGSLIARLEDSERTAELARAEAVMQQRRASWERVKRVVEQGAGAAQDLDDAESALQVAKADVDLAKARLAKTRITAPFDGIVGPRVPSPGAFLRAGSPIVELARVSEIEVSFSVPERYAAELKRDAEVSVSNPGWPGYVVTGRVYVVDPNVDPRTRAVRVIARLPNPDRRFLPGMSANVRAALAVRASAVTMPAEAVFAEGDQFLTYVVQPDSTVMPIPVKLGTRLAGAVEVLEGVQPGDRVVRAGHQKLYPGAKVIAVNSEAPAAPDGEATPDADTAGGNDSGDAEGTS
jgi:membrane fusion protein (multidrug efflux system)